MPTLSIMCQRCLVLFIVFFFTRTYGQSGQTCPLAWVSFPAFQCTQSCPSASSALNCPQDSSGGAVSTFPNSPAVSSSPYCCACVPAPDYTSAPVRRLCPSTNLAAMSAAVAAITPPNPDLVISLMSNQSASVNLGSGFLLAIDPGRSWAAAEYLILDLSVAPANPSSTGSTAAAAAGANASRSSSPAPPPATTRAVGNNQQRLIINK